jgi:two-component system, OmpR family, phosphate regulon sensor histidine kinase PhoR
MLIFAQLKVSDINLNSKVKQRLTFAQRMNTSTPRSLATYLALWFSCSVGVFVGLMEYIFHLQYTIWVPIVVVVFTFSLSFFLFQFAVERFIYRKIKLIYKNIHQLKLKKGQKPKSVDLNTDIISAVNTDVEAWAKDQKEEIEYLKNLENYRREFLGNVSHELKTPIFNIQGYIMTLLEGGLEDPAINRTYLERAEKSVERMVNIVEDLEIITQFESGQLILHKERFDIVELARDTMSSIQYSAEKNNVKLLFKETYEKPIMVKADKESIQKVLSNLLVNSIKYCKPVGETKVSFYDMDENILVEVTDNGIGVAQEHIPRLFERFYRVDRSRSREIGGTGLGLSIVKHIIEAHNQTINVRSTLGIGTTFGFTLSKAR